MKKPLLTPFLLFPLVLLALWLPRGLALDRFVTVDEPKWLMRSANFYQALSSRQFQFTFQREHPGVTITWAGAAGFFWRFRNYVDIRPGQIERPGRLNLFLRNREISPLDLLVAGRTFVVLGIVASLGLAFLTLARLLGAFPAAFAILLVAFDPFFIGLSRLLHLDGLVSALMLLSILAFFDYLYHGRQVRSLLLSGIAGGLAWLTKSPAFFLAPFFGLLLLLEWLKVRRFNLAILWKAFSPWLLWFGVAGVVFVLLWPAMWVDPLGSLQKVFSLAETYASEGHDSSLFFGGVIYDIGKSPWFFYPVTYAWRTTPVVLLGLGLALLALIFPRWLPLSPDRRRLVGVFILFAVLFSLFLSLSAKKFDRYLLPVFGPLDIVAGLGYLSLAQPLRQVFDRYLLPVFGPVDHVAALGWLALAERRTFFASAGLAGVVILGQFWGAFQTYPYYLNYYNPLLGGGVKAQTVMQVGWGEGLDQAARYLNAKPGAEEMKVFSWAADGCFSYFFLGSAGTIDYDMSVRDMRHADYIVFYLNQVQRQAPTPEFLAFFEHFQPEYVVRIDGLEYARVYNISTIPEDEFPSSGSIHQRNVGGE